MVRRILVIDDDEAIRKVMLLALESTPLQVDTASSGEQGMELAGSVDYDLVYLDLTMPGMNGIETLRALKALHPDLKVYFMTGYYGDYADDLRMVAAAGLDFELLKKPLSIGQIVDVTMAILDGGLMSD